LLAGKYDEEINKGLDDYARKKSGSYQEALIKA
jgi:hypothetical protein